MQHERQINFKRARDCSEIAATPAKWIAEPFCALRQSAKVVLNEVKRKAVAALLWQHIDVLSSAHNWVGRPTRPETRSYSSSRQRFRSGTFKSHLRQEEIQTGVTRTESVWETVYLASFSSMNILFIKTFAPQALLCLYTVWHVSSVSEPCEYKVLYNKGAVKMAEVHFIEPQ